MLHEFLIIHRAELIARCGVKAAKRNDKTLLAGSQFGVPQFLTQLVEIFRAEQTPTAIARRATLGARHPSLSIVPSDIAGTAAKHGVEMRQQGLSLDAVVHGYGDLCQALTELALEMGAPITVDEFHTFNRCLDDAIADAVTSYSRQGAGPAAAAAPQPLPVEELRSLIDVARHSFAAIKAGEVGLSGTTSALHERSLADMDALLKRVFGGGPQVRGEKKQGP
jgi:hypothetical protein